MRLAAVVVAVIVLGVVAAAAVSPGSDGEESPDLTTEALGERLRQSWQSDLRDAQRDRGLDGELSVVRVDCVNKKYPHFICLAHVAARGEARRLAPRPITITGRHGGGGGFVARERE